MTLKHHPKGISTPGVLAVMSSVSSVPSRTFSSVVLGVPVPRETFGSVWSCVIVTKAGGRHVLASHTYRSGTLLTPHSDRTAPNGDSYTGGGM